MQRQWLRLSGCDVVCGCVPVSGGSSRLSNMMPAVPDMMQLKSGVRSVAGKLSGMASGVVSSIQVSFCLCWTRSPVWMRATNLCVFLQDRYGTWAPLEPPPQTLPHWVKELIIRPSLWPVFFCFCFSWPAFGAFDGDSVWLLGNVRFGDQISSVIEVKYLHSFTFALFWDVNSQFFSCFLQ